MSSTAEIMLAAARVLTRFSPMSSTGWRRPGLLSSPRIGADLGLVGGLKRTQQALPAPLVVC